MRIRRNVANGVLYIMAAVAACISYEDNNCLHHRHHTLPQWQHPHYYLLLLCSLHCDVVVLSGPQLNHIAATISITTLLHSWTVSHTHVCENADT